jgi:hypothetical protein
MKKLALFASSAAGFLALAPHVLAADNDLNPCKGSNTVLNAACAGKDLSIGQVVGFVVTIAFVIAVLVALFFLIWGGIKWITSGGDKGGVESARNQIVAAVIGLIIVFLAFFILNLVLQLFGLSLFDLKLPDFQHL